MKYVIYRKSDNLYYTGKHWSENRKAIFNRNIMAAKVYKSYDEAQKSADNLNEDSLIITRYFR